MRKTIQSLTVIHRRIALNRHLLIFDVAVERPDRQIFESDMLKM